MLALLAAVFTVNATADSRFDRLLSELDQLAARERVNAYALAIVDRSDARHPIEQVVGRGKTGNVDFPAASAHTPFRVGSITKTFTALTLLQLLRDHQLAVDTPVLKIAADAPFENRWESTQPLRVVHVLEHTAGFRELGPIEWNWTAQEPIPLAQSLRLEPQTRVLRWPPGAQFSYSNVSPVISQFLIERLCGEDYVACATKLTLKPLGMTDAAFLPMPTLPKGYKADGETEIPYWHQTFLAYGALNASAADMAKLLRFFIDRGGAMGFTADDVDDIETPHSSLAARSGLTLGYGLGLYSTVSSGHRFFGHGGDGDGFLSRFGYLPAFHRGYFVTINADNPPAAEHFRALVEQFVAADLPAPSPEDGPADIAALDAVSGQYEAVATRFGNSSLVGSATVDSRPTITIQRQNNALRIDGDVEAELLPSRPAGAFRRRDEAFASAIFVRQDGELYLQGELGNFHRIRP